MKCSICGRKLESGESISRGIGSKCAERYTLGVAAAGWSLQALESVEISANAEAAERIRRAKLAIGARRFSEAKFWFERAAEFTALLEAA